MNIYEYMSSGLLTKDNMKTYCKTKFNKSSKELSLKLYDPKNNLMAKFNVSCPSNIEKHLVFSLYVKDDCNIISFYNDNQYKIFYSDTYREYINANITFNSENRIYASKHDYISRELKFYPYTYWDMDFIKSSKNYYRINYKMYFDSVYNIILFNNKRYTHIYEYYVNTSRFIKYDELENFDTIVNQTHHMFYDALSNFVRLRKYNYIFCVKDTELTTKVKRSNKVRRLNISNKSGSIILTNDDDTALYLKLLL